MSTFNRDALRKGAEAIDEAVAEAEARRNQEYRPFLPSIYWKEDQEYKYLLFLNPIEEIPRVEFHPYIETDDGFPHMAFARTDDSIGDRTDPIQEQWGYKPRRTNLAVAVELDPVTKMINGREKPVGFEVKTVSFERRVRDDNDELTEEREEVWAPVVGLVSQSPHNFFNGLRSFDATEAPIQSTPVKITRLGKKDNVHYQVTGYENVELDLTNLFEYIENVNYVTDPETLLDGMANKEDFDAAGVIGDYLLWRRIEELADLDNYNEILENISQPSRFGEKKSGGRPPRPSQRRKRQPPKSRDDNDDAPKARGRSQDDTVSKVSPVNDRLKRLREKGQAAQAEA